MTSHAQFYQIKNFDSESGLPSSEVYSVMQDSKGYLWFATDMGVSKFNGYEFKNYSTENGLSDNTVFSFFEDSKNRIWFLSQSGRLSYFLNDSIYSLRCNPIISDITQLESDIIHSIHVDAGDTIWLGLRDLILKIEPGWNEDNLKQITIPDCGGYIYLIDENAFISNGRHVAGCLISVYGKSLNRIIQITPSERGDYNVQRRFTAIRLTDGSFLVSAGNELINFDRSGILSSTIEDAELISLLETKEQQIISASYSGVRIYADRKLTEFEEIPMLFGKTVTDVIVDHENSLWFSTEGQGVYYIPFRNCKYYTPENGLEKSKISCLVLNNNLIVTGHLSGAISLIENDKITLVNKEQNQKSTANTRIRCLVNGNDSALFVGSIPASYVLIYPHLEKQLELTDFQIKKMVPVEETIFWGLQSTRLVKFDASENFRILEVVPFNRYADDIFYDSKGTLWIGSINGVWIFENDSLINLGDTYPIFKSRIINIVEDANGRIWMASRGNGILVKDGNTVFTIQVKDGLASNMCRNMFIDSEQNVWVGSNKGLSQIRILNHNSSEFSYDISVYTKENGLLTNEVNFIAQRDDKLILAHNSGLSIFNPNHLENKSTPPPVHITGISVKDQIYLDDTIQLPYSQNYLSINYVGLTYKNPGNVEYKYKMEGIDTSWVYTKYTTAQFQTLAPGKYTFIVYAKNNYGVWSKSPAVAHIIILPLWWQTWWFKTILILLGVFLVYVIITKRIRSVRRAVQEKSDLQIRLASTELKALRAQMNPHFIYNTLNSIQYFITNNNPDSSQRYLSKFAKLIRYVLDNSKVAEIPFEKELEAITIYMELEALRFENKFEFSIMVDSKIDTHNIQIPSMLIQPYIENAIWHGIMHKKEKGRIELIFELQNDCLKCIIKDNGIGQKKSRELKSADNFQQHKSVGMTNTQERLEIINSMNKSNLSVKVIDLVDEQKNALGTLVELYVPLK
jgi:ligand-binding sensor domain-containing protein